MHYYNIIPVLGQIPNIWIEFYYILWNSPFRRNFIKNFVKFLKKVLAIQNSRVIIALAVA